MARIGQIATVMLAAASVAACGGAVDGATATSGGADGAEEPVALAVFPEASRHGGVPVGMPPWCAVGVGNATMREGDGPPPSGPI